MRGKKLLGTMVILAVACVTGCVTLGALARAAFEGMRFGWEMTGHFFR